MMFVSFRNVLVDFAHTFLTSGKTCRPSFKKIPFYSYLIDGKLLVQGERVRRQAVVEHTVT